MMMTLVKIRKSPYYQAKIRWSSFGGSASNETLVGCTYSENQCAEVAQLVEHSPEKAGVDSSILSLGTIFPLLTRF